MRIRNYKENRDLFKTISKESVEGRVTIDNIRKLKTKADESLENIITGAVGAAVFATISISIFRGDLGQPNFWGYLFACMSAGLSIGSFLAGVGSYFVRQETVENLNKDIEGILEENKEMTL